jgi:hypothetical protein
MPSLARRSTSSWIQKIREREQLQWVGLQCCQKDGRGTETSLGRRQRKRVVRCEDVHGEWLVCWVVVRLAASASVLLCGPPTKVRTTEPQPSFIIIDIKTVGVRLMCVA